MGNHLRVCGFTGELAIHRRPDAVERMAETMDDRGPDGRGSWAFRADHVDELLPAPNDHVTALEGSKLWQLALLELWPARHGI